MLKKYSQFILEKNFEGSNSIGEYIESLAKDDEYALNIISQYTQDIDPTIRLANAINLLDKSTQNFILKMIKDHKSGNEEQKEPKVSAYIDAGVLESQQVLGGKNLFKCFLKIITALGQKNLEVNWNNDNFLLLFKTISLNVAGVKSVMSRYQYFGQFINQIDYTQNECHLYYGITGDLNFQYGILNEEQILPFGQFKITKSILNFLLTLSSPSSINLKKYLINFDLTKLSLFSKIKSEMKNFIPGSSEKKSNPIINGDIITFGYYGIGKWDNGQMDAGELENVKTNFKTFLSKYKWAEKVQVSVTSNQFWLYLNIKLK